MASGWLISAWQGRNARGLFHGPHEDRGKGVSVAACDLVGPLQTPAPLAFCPHGPSAQLALPPEYASDHSNPLSCRQRHRDPRVIPQCAWQVPGGWHLGSWGRQGGASVPFARSPAGTEKSEAPSSQPLSPPWKSLPGCKPRREEFAGRRKQQDTLLMSSCCPPCVSACAGGPRSRA